MNVGYTVGTVSVGLGGESEEEKQWSCEKLGPVNLQKVGLMVPNIGEPCLSQWPIKFVNLMLKPDKWQATFDSDGKVSDFRKALKLIVLGGVDPSIKPQVWEFLLGCYALSSTAQYRRQLRTARRERYKNLIKQCQMMHSSIGTGALAYIVGSKVMDMRTFSKIERGGEAGIDSRQVSTDSTNKFNQYSNWNNNCTDTPYARGRDSSSNSAEIDSLRGSTDSPVYDSSFVLPASGPSNSSLPIRGEEANGSEYDAEGYIDFPALPVMDLFGKRVGYNEEHDKSKHSTQQELRYEDERMHSFESNNDIDLIMESNGEPSTIVSYHRSEIELVCCDNHEPKLGSLNVGYENELVNGLRTSDALQTSFMQTSATTYGELSACEDGVSEWLWTLHRIVIDVVRTDGHLEFYEDKRNLARMSDILAVYAWVDPATGYCQGMSDLLSPFVVLFEDDADAFWCFEMLLRRMHENFQMKGPTGVMRQLQVLWHVLELTDEEIFAHLSRIGAESLHFAFRMLMVLFRWELSFSEVLKMWEMMWAADFDESMAYALEENCLEALIVHLPRDSGVEMKEETRENDNDSSNPGSLTKNGNVKHSKSNITGMKSSSSPPFCGLTKNFCTKNDDIQISAVVSSTKNGDDELPVFCAAAILIMNRQKIMKEARSIDDLIKIFNDNLLKIRVRRCVHTAIKLRKKYFYKLIKSKSPAAQKVD